MHTCKRREREKERRRQDIIDVAGDLFFSRGYDDVTMEDVAAASELSTGTLYLYFKNKDALFCAVVMEGLSALNGMFKGAVLKGNTGAEKLRAVGEAYLEYYRRFPGEFRAFVEMQARPLPDEGTMAQISAVIRENVYGIMCSCIEEGTRDGSLRPGLHPLQTALYAIYSMQSVICLTPAQEAVLEREKIPHDDFIRNSLGLLISSISAKDPGDAGVKP